jgi:hypothetical protein
MNLADGVTGSSKVPKLYLDIPNALIELGPKVKPCLVLDVGPKGALESYIWTFNFCPTHT